MFSICFDTRLIFLLCQLLFSPTDIFNSSFINILSIHIKILPARVKIEKASLQYVRLFFYQQSWMAELFCKNFHQINGARMLKSSKAMRYNTKKLYTCEFQIFFLSLPQRDKNLWKNWYLTRESYNISLAGIALDTFFHFIRFFLFTLNSKSENLAFLRGY